MDDLPRPVVAVTMGDPAGIGPEICCHLLASDPRRLVAKPVIFGDAKVLRAAAAACGLPSAIRVIDSCDWRSAVTEIESSAVYHIPALAGSGVHPGVVNAATGRASYAYIEAAIEAAMAGDVDAVSTGPIQKEALRAAGVPYPGHTEMFAEKTNAGRSCMMLTCEQISCSLVTAHIGLRDVPGQISRQRIVDVIQLSHEAVRRMRGREPRIVVCGLNPHAGEAGMFGDEERRFILPAVEHAREKGICVEGPLSPDTAFLPERRRVTDCYVCMYHDQGLIPLKTLAFDEAVNVTLGLPIIRTSVDHGTALDIAWQGKASPNSLFEAVSLAARLAVDRLPSAVA